MPDAVVMPRMGYDMTEGTVARWLKREGDLVRAEEVIAEIETDKAVVEMESGVDGLLLKVIVVAGMTVPVGHAIAYVGEAGETIPAEVEMQCGERVPSRTATNPAPPAPAEPVGETPADPRLRASPVARRLAAERGVDIASVRGSGPGGRITRDDVLDMATRSQDAKTSSPPEQEHSASRTPGPDGRIPLGKMGQAIARRTQATIQDTPHFYLTVQIDMTKAMELRATLNEASSTEAHVSLNDVIIKACAVAVERFPVFNSTFEGDHLQVHPHVNVGIAIALPDGLIVPAILECERKSIEQIASDAKAVTQRALSGTLLQEEYTGTFSVSNLGMFGVDDFTAIVVSPQVAVLAVGAAKPTAVAVGGKVVVRPMMAATLCTDHRAAHGAEAAQLAGKIKRLLEDPASLTSA